MATHESLTEEIRALTTNLHQRFINEGTLPTFEEKHRIIKLFKERDTDKTLPYDLEMSHVMRGFEWGFNAMLNIIEGYK